MDTTPNVRAENELVDTSLRSLRRQFSGLEPPPMSTMQGRFRAEIVGPSWLRRLAPAGLRVTGLKGWWGKEFDGHGGCANLVQDPAGDLQVTLPMRVVWGRSPVDGRPGLLLRYAPDARWPWRHVVDEVRVRDERTLVGMTLMDRPGLRYTPLPFLLHRP